MLKNFFDSIRNSRKPIFEGFNDAKDVFGCFDVPEEDTDGLEIVFALYDTEPYEGSAVVFYFSSDTGKYHEVYGSHCSCYGLEGQWGAEEICFEELETRLHRLSYLGNQSFVSHYEEFKKGV